MAHRQGGSPFLEEVRNAIRVRHYSLRTEDAYLGWIRRFILFHGKRHPTRMGETEVGAFLTDLAVNGQGRQRRRIRPSMPWHFSTRWCSGTRWQPLKGWCGRRNLSACRWY